MSNRPEVILIAAVSRNGVIGRNNALPWRLKSDLAHFKARTLGHAVLMGRKTWESIGRPLLGRRNLVVTRDPGYPAKGADVFTNPEAALKAVTGERVFVIGGADLYRQLIGQADRLLITEVWADIEGDAHFPPIDPMNFSEERREAHSADADNEHDFDLVEYRRRRG